MQGTWLDKARAHYAAGDYDKAVEACTEALKADPDNVLALTRRGLAYIRLHNFDAAIQDFDRAIELNTRDAAIYFNRGNAHYAGRSDYRQAITDYSKAIELDPRDTASHYNRGLAYMKTHSFQEAIHDFGKVIALHPYHVNARVNRGEAFRKIGAYDQAMRDFDIAIKLEPENATAYLERGNLYAQLGDARRAARDLQTGERKKVYEERLHHGGVDERWEEARGIRLDGGGALRSEGDGRVGSRPVVGGQAEPADHEGPP